MTSYCTSMLGSTSLFDNHNHRNEPMSRSLDVSMVQNPAEVAAIVYLHVQEGMLSYVFFVGLKLQISQQL